MEQPNGGMQVKQVQAFRIVMEWVPSVGSFNVGWPEGLDDVAIYGMLEFAKALRAEQRAQAGIAGERKLIVPAGRIQN
jgi:hypothetical protein